jgi:hypothetical protein
MGQKGQDLAPKLEQLRNPQEADESISGQMNARGRDCTHLVPSC